MTVQETKKSAKIKLKGNFLRCASSTLLYFIIIMILTFLSNLISVKLEDYTVPLTIIQAIFAIVSSILSYGLIANILALSDGETKSITKFIDFSIMNGIKYIKIIFQILIRILIPLVIFLLCLFYLIGTVIAVSANVSFLCFYPNLLPLAIIICLISLVILIYFTLKYVLSPYIYYTDSKLTSKEIVQKSKELMKGQKTNYILLILSFFGWIILVAFILYVLGYFIDSAWMTPIIIVFYSLIRPYMVTSESIFYENLGKE